MIVRSGDGEGLELVTQTDHSKLVGKLAARWGAGNGFDRPEPYESMARAAAYHDFGWLRYETSPLVHPDTGEPYAFLQVPLSREQLAAYQWSLDWMEELDPYAGLIVSMHRTGLWKARYGAIDYPTSYNLADPSPEIQSFIDRNETHQKTLSQGFDWDRLWTNYRLMQVWDLLGLYFCCAEPTEDAVEPVPRRYGEEQGVRLRLEPRGAHRVAVDPFPFDERPFRLELPVRRLPQRRFPDLQSFRRSYYRADVELVHFEIV